MKYSALLTLFLTLLLDAVSSLLTPSTNAVRRVNWDTSICTQESRHAITSRLSMSHMVTLPVPYDPDHVKPDEPKDPDEPQLSDEDRVEDLDSTVDEPEDDGDMGE